MLRDAVSSTVLHFDLHGVWVPAFAGTTVDRFAQSITNLNAQFSEHSSRRDKTLFASLAIEEERDVMERRDFLKIALGVVAGAAAMAASAQAAPLSPQALAPDGRLPANPDAHSAVTSGDEVDRLKPEEVRWGHGHHRGWGHRHWGWRRRRHWGWRSPSSLGLAPQALGLASPPPLVPPPLLASPLLVGRRDGLIPQALSTQAFNTSTKKAPHEAGLFLRSGNVRSTRQRP